jgi:hypothetical protein
MKYLHSLKVSIVFLSRGLDTMFLLSGRNKVPGIAAPNRRCCFYEASTQYRAKEIDWWKSWIDNSRFAFRSPILWPVPYCHLPEDLHPECCTTCIATQPRVIKDDDFRASQSQVLFIHMSFSIVLHLLLATSAHATCRIEAALICNDIYVLTRSGAGKQVKSHTLTNIIKVAPSTYG